MKKKAKAGAKKSPVKKKAKAKAPAKKKAVKRKSTSVSSKRTMSAGAGGLAPRNSGPTGPNEGP
jgi:hypothetical protein